jgi:heterodisulfide reductase subunit A
LGPKDITDSVVQAGAAAAKASELLNGEIEVEPKFIEIDGRLCDNCGKCISVCRYKAIYFKETSSNGKHSTSSEKSNQKNNNAKIIAVDPLACAGCGGCVPECKTGAISQKNCSDEQLNGAVAALLSGKKPGEKRIIAFLDSKVAYIAADNAGANRLNCGDDVYIVRVPSTNRIGINHILHAFKEGADGIFLGEGPENGPMGRMFGNVQERFNIMRTQLAKEGIDPKRLFFAKVYAPHFRGLIEKIDLFKKDLGITA